VHPRNILVDENGSPRIVDFGRSRVAGVESQFRRSQRGGFGYFFAPDYANAVRGGHHPPYASITGEQYAVAALLHFRRRAFGRRQINVA
jgi:serine/threonine protein kinase